MKLILVSLALLCMIGVAQAQPATTTVPGTLFTNPVVIPWKTTIQGAPFGLVGNQSATAWTTTGIRYANTPGTLTDTSSSGTVATAYTSVFGGDTVATNSVTTFTNYYGAFYKAPVAGINATFTHNYALGADSANFTSLAIGGTAMALPVTVTNGGSGAATFAVHGTLVGEGTGAFASVVGSTVGQCWIAQGASSDPIFGGCGNLPTNAQTGAYAIVATDCGKLVTESGAQVAVTLPAASTVADGCIITLTNISTTRAQELISWPDPRALGSTYSGGTNFCGGSCLWPGQTFQVQSNHGTWQALVIPGRYFSTVNPMIYVGCSVAVNAGSCGVVTLCSDSNDGITQGAPVCTIQQALNIVQSQFDRGGVNGWMQLIAGVSGGAGNYYTGGFLVAGQNGERADGITVIASPESTFSATISSSVMTVSAVAAGTIHVGDYLFTPGGPISGGYFVLSNGTGSGGTGTYNIGFAGVVCTSAAQGCPTWAGTQTVNGYTLNATRIIAPSGGFAAAAFDTGIMFLTNLAVNCTSGAYGVYSYQFSTVEINNVEATDCAGGTPFVAFNHGHIDIDGGLVLAGSSKTSGSFGPQGINSAVFWADQGGQISTYNVDAVACAASLSAKYFAEATQGGQIIMVGATFNGCSYTAARFIGDGPGSLLMTGTATGLPPASPNANYFPGSTGGLLGNGAVNE